MINEIVFDSAKNRKETVSLASGYVSLNQISFVNEEIVAKIEAKTGEVEFCDTKLQKLLSCKMEPDALGDEKFSDIELSVESDKIKLGFPRYTYHDNYPNCDGESDRWDKRISGFDYLVYDFKNNCIVE